MNPQLEFDFSSFTKEPFAKEVHESVSPSHKPCWTRRQMIQKIIAWLIDHGADAVGTYVPTNLVKNKVDVAALWVHPARNVSHTGPKMIYQPDQITVVKVCLTREECWPTCLQRETLASQLRDLHHKLIEIQVRIRQNEPHLRRGQSLFAEFEEYDEWKYDETKDSEYHQVKNQIRKIEQILYQGTLFDHITRHHLVDYGWLAVPEGIIYPEEMPRNWGLLWLKSDRTMVIKQIATFQEATEPNRIHMAINIALASRGAMLFTHGIMIQDEQTILGPFPKRRHRILI